MSALGKIWATAGLRDLLVDSGVYAGCTVDQILQGKQFNRGVRAYTLAYEALTALNFHAFFQCGQMSELSILDPLLWTSPCTCTLLCILLPYQRVLRL
jgi:hypothetical protein